MLLGIDLYADISSLAPSTVPTVAELLPEYLANRAAVQARTVTDAASMFRDHILPTFADTPLDKIDRAAVEAWQARLEKTRAPKTVRNIRSTFISFLKAHGYSPFATVRTPRLDEDEELEPVILTLDEIDDLVSRIHPTWQPLYRLLGYTGLRMGEALALKADDFGTSTVTVRRAIKRGGETGPPKNKASRRTISVDAVTMVYISQRPVAPDGWIFAGPRTGRPTLASTLWKEKWNPVTRDMVPRPRPHDLRHSHAVMLLDKGVPAAQVRDRLGHADVATTLRIYNRARRKNDDDVMAAINGHVGQRLRAV